MSEQSIIASDAVQIHKSNTRETDPLVSIILLDWEVRERFHALDWLNRQDCPREQYELIWVELYHRVVPEVVEKCDVVITCGQKGMYHKHLGYNVGLLEARGKLITVCDSDAVFPPDFINSILESFEWSSKGEPEPLVLMHDEWRSGHFYPDELTSVEELPNYKWYDLWHNVGACMTVSRREAIRCGGFDEDESYRGYMCGPYDLGWRMLNAGADHRWHDPKVALWHFAHPDPVGSSGQAFSMKMWKEITRPHFEHHAITAIEAFSAGDILPRTENPRIHEMRIQSRRIFTTEETRLGNIPLEGKRFSWRRNLRCRLTGVLEMTRLIKNTWPAILRSRLPFGRTAVRSWLGKIGLKKRA